MKIGYISASETGETDRLLTEVAAALTGAGLRLAGTVQSNPPRPGSERCDMVLRVLPGGPEFRISADRGEAARGCRLDADGLEAAALVAARQLAGADLLLLNKFGRQEAIGRGLVSVLVEALDLGLPVLIGVGRRNMAEFEAFSGGLAEPLPEDLSALVAWGLRHAAARPNARVLRAKA